MKQLYSVSNSRWPSIRAQACVICEDNRQRLDGDATHVRDPNLARLMLHSSVLQALMMRLDENPWQ
jgi:hypothetical protein